MESKLKNKQPFSGCFPEIPCPEILCPEILCPEILLTDNILLHILTP